MLKIRRPLGRLIFNMGIAIPGKTVFLIETAPWVLFQYKDHLSRDRGFHYKYNVVSYLYHLNSYTCKMTSYMKTAPENNGRHAADNIFQSIL